MARESHVELHARSLRRAVTSLAVKLAETDRAIGSTLGWTEWHRAAVAIGLRIAGVQGQAPYLAHAKRVYQQTTRQTTTMESTQREHEKTTMKLHQIKHLDTQAVLYSGEHHHLRAAVEAAVKAKVSLARANLTGAYLESADLAGANLESADLAGAYLAHADLAGANLTHANLTHAVLDGADLTGTDLTHAVLTGADLYCANLTNATLIDATLGGASFTGADIAGAKFPIERTTTDNDEH